MNSCIFCKIVDRQSLARIVYEDETALAIEDLHPQAPVHLLVLPKEHAEDLSEAGQDAVGHLFKVAARLAEERGLKAKGYRTVVNNGAGAGQTVFHLHIHVLGGRPFHWPPG